MASPKEIVDGMMAQAANSNLAWCEINNDGTVRRINWDVAAALVEHFLDGNRTPLVMCAVVATGARALALAELKAQEQEQPK